MGMDVYVGPLTRYALGAWLTVVQQAGMADGIQVQVDRPAPEQDDVLTDPLEVQDAVDRWQRGLNTALGGEPWPDSAELPYWTDKPDWDGYGGLVLLAAYEERPKLAPGAKRGPFTRGVSDDPRLFEESAAYQEASKSPTRYVTLLSGVKWWLPLDSRAGVFHGPRLTGEETVMATVDQLVTELRDLAQVLGLTDSGERERIRRAGPPPRRNDVTAYGRFGLAAFLKLAETAQRERQPLLLDY